MSVARTPPQPSPPPGELVLRMQSDPAEIADVRRRVEQFATAHGFGEIAVGEIGLTLNEAIANIIRHAYHGAPDKPIEITVRVQDKELVMFLRDYGSGKMPDLSKEKLELHTPGGIGLPCMKQMLDTVEFEPQSDGMLLRMSKRRR